MLKLLFIIGLVLFAPFLLKAESLPGWLRSAVDAPVDAFAKDATAVMLLDEGQMQVIDQAGKFRFVRRTAVRILSDRGRAQASNIVVPFDAYTRVAYIKGWTIKADKAVVELDKKQIRESSRFGEYELYSDDRYKIFSLPGVEKGAVIGYEYAVEGTPVIHADTWIFQHDIPVRQARYTLTLPPGWLYVDHIFNATNNAIAKRSLAGDAVVWEGRELAAIKPETRMPPLRDLRIWMGLYYYPNKDGMSSWEKISQWYGELSRSTDAADAAVAEKAKDLTKDLPSRLDKIKAISYYLQKQVRYVAVEVGIGGYKPHSPAHVFKNKYGDCKDKVALMGAMLSAVGIEAYPALVLTKDAGSVEPKFPAPIQFNHAILSIPVKDFQEQARKLPSYSPGENLLWIDPTSETTPFGFLPIAVQGAQALVVDGRKGKLVTTPVSDPEVNLRQRKVRANLGADGKALFVIEENLFGSESASWRAYLKSLNDQDKQQALEERIAKKVSHSQLQKYNFQNLDGFDDPLKITYQFFADKYSEVMGSLILFRPVIFQSSLGKFVEEMREYPIVFEHGWAETDEVTFVLPYGFEIDEWPESVRIENPFMRFSLVLERSEKALILKKEFFLKKIRIPPEQYGDFNRSLSQIQAADQVSIVLKRKAK